MPERLAELKRLFELEASKYNVFPLDARAVERLSPDLAGRPRAVRGSTQLLYGGMRRLPENSLVNIFSKSFSVTAEIQVPEEGAQGVILAYGGRPGGFSIYNHQGRLKYCYNLFGVQRFTIQADALPAGTHQVRKEFAYDGGGPAKGGTVTLYVDGIAVGQVRLERTMGFHFTFDEALDLGVDTASPVTDDYPAKGNQFNGTVNWVQIDIDQAAADQDHLISPEERFRIAMARQ